MPSAEATQSVADFRFWICGFRLEPTIDGLWMTELVAAVERIKNQKSKIKNDDDLKDEGPGEFVISDSKFETQKPEACKLFRLGFRLEAETIG